MMCSCASAEAPGGLREAIVVGVPCRRSVTRRPDAPVRISTDSSTFLGRTVTLPEVDAQRPGERLVAVVGAANPAGVGDGNWTGADEMAERVEQQGGHALVIALADEHRQDPGATGDRPFTFSSDATLSGVMLALQPARTELEYDSSGNRVEMDGPDGVARFGYDQARRLTSVEQGGAETGYSYNGDGLRIAKSENGTAASFAWDLVSPVPLLLSDGDRAFVYGPGGVPISEIRGTTSQYFHQDHLGSTRGLSGTDGSVEGTYTYDAFGQVIAHTGATTPLQFAGEYRDAESGLLYLRARHYDPATGQFLTRDPIEARTGEPYAYAGNNPVNRTDPMGLCWGPGCWVEQAIEVGVEIASDPGAALADAGKGAWNFGVGAINALTGSDNCGFDGPGLSWSTNIGSATVWIETALAGAGAARGIAIGREYSIGSRGTRVAPWGNRGPGRYHLPHYHRGKPHPTRPGQNLTHQGLKRHRPWETKPSDTSGWDRF